MNLESVAMPIKLPLATALVVSLIGAGAMDQAGTGECVTFAVPQPARVFTYEHLDPSGRTTNTQQWERVTQTESRVRTTGPEGVQININTHRIVNDVAVISLTRKTSASGGLISSTEFNPGLVSD